MMQNKYLNIYLRMSKLLFSTCWYWLLLLLLFILLIVWQIENILKCELRLFTILENVYYQNDERIIG